MNLAGMWATFVTTIRSSFRVRVHGNYSRVSDIRFFRNQARIGSNSNFKMNLKIVASNMLKFYTIKIQMSQLTCWNRVKKKIEDWTNMYNSIKLNGSVIRYSRFSLSSPISTWLVEVVWRSIISSRHGEIAPPTRGLSCNRARSPVTRGVSARFVIEERSVGETDRMEKSLDCRSRGLADLFVRTIRLCTTNIVYGDDWKSRSYNFSFFQMKKIKWNTIF